MFILSETMYLTMTVKHMALADRGYDMQQLKNGIWASGRVAYKKKNVDMV